MRREFLVRTVLSVMADQIPYDPKTQTMVTDQTGREWPGVPGWGDDSIRQSSALPVDTRRSIAPVPGEKPVLHPDYHSNCLKFKFYEASYKGGADYKSAEDACGKPVFLTHPSEDEESSNYRKDISMCRNYCKPICKKFGSFIFSQTIIRDVKIAQFVEWCKDVDGNGTPISNFFEAADDDARYLGFYGIVFDTTKRNILQTEAVAAVEKNRPVLSCLHPSRIVNWSDDKQELLIKYDIGEFGQLWLWKKLTYQKFIIDKDGKIGAVGPEIAHGYSRMPIVLISGVDEWESLIVDIAEAQRRLFVLDSLLIEEQVKQTFTSWALFGVDSSQLDGADTLPLGGRKFLCFKEKKDQIDIRQLGSNVDQAASLRESMQEDVLYIYRCIGLRPPDDGKSGPAESGRTLRIREAETVATTERIAGNIELAENAIIDLYNEAMKSGVEHTQYPNEFNSDDIQILLQNTLQVVSNGFGPMLKATQTKRYIHQAFPELPPDERAELETEADDHFEEAAETAQAIKAGPVQPDNPSDPNKPEGPEPESEKAQEQPGKGVLGVTDE